MRSPARRPTVTRDAFNALWLGQTVSALGTQVSMVALPLIAVLTLNVGPFELGILAALETVPYLILSLPAGAVVDRVDHRRTMIACDIGRAVALLGTTVAMALGVLSIGLLCVVALVVGSLSVFFTVAYTSYLAAILPPERLVAGNQRLELSESGARVAGPSIGGALMQLAGGAAAATLDGLSYLVSALAIVGSGRPARTAPVPSSQVGFLESMGAGLRHVLGDRILRDLACSTAIFNLGSGMILAVVVLFATREVGLDAAGFGLVYGLGNIGFVLGAVLVGFLTTRFGVGRTFAWSSFASAGAMILIAAAGSGTGAVFLLAGRFVGAAATPIYNVDSLSLRQARVSHAIMGRVNGTFQFLEWGALPVGSLVGGVLGAALGPRAALAAAAICGIASAIWIATSPARHLTSLEGSRVGAGAADARPAAVGDATPDDQHDPSIRPPLVA
jgi:MFS family permease